VVWWSNQTVDEHCRHRPIGNLGFVQRVSARSERDRPFVSRYAPGGKVRLNCPSKPPQHHLNHLVNLTRPAPLIPRKLSGNSGINTMGLLCTRKNNMMMNMNNSATRLTVKVKNAPCEYGGRMTSNYYFTSPSPTRSTQPACSELTQVVECEGDGGVRVNV
jgi:hypothetical protein